MPPASYATVPQYKARTGASTIKDGDETLTAQLQAASRVVDRSLLATPGMYADTAAATFEFVVPSDLRAAAGHAIARDTLRLRDEAGTYLLRTLTSLTIDGDNLATAKAKPVPRNAAEFGLPYWRLQRDDGEYWQAGTVVAITGTWGHHPTPSPIVELTIYTATVMRQLEKGGAAATVQIIDDTIQFNDAGWRLWRDAKRAYTLDTGARR